MQKILIELLEREKVTDKNIVQYLSESKKEKEVSDCLRKYENLKRKKENIYEFNE